jgi:hypothetical protein
MRLASMATAPEPERGGSCARRPRARCPHQLRCPVCIHTPLCRSALPRCAYSRPGRLAPTRARSACSPGVNRVPTAPQLRGLLLPSEAAPGPVASATLVKSLVVILEHRSRNSSNILDVSLRRLRTSQDVQIVNHSATTQIEEILAHSEMPSASPLPSTNMSKRMLNGHTFAQLGPPLRGLLTLS